MATAIYVRISRDPAGERAGVTRQRDDCLAYCEERGWDVLDVFEDDDRSASSGARRPAYERMLVAEPDRIIVWAMDRLYRKITELEEIIERAEAGQLEVHAVMGGEFDLRTADGRAYARTLVTHAQHEAEKASERQRRKKAQLAADGLPNGGPKRYGYERDFVTVIEEEAEVIREVVDRVLAGESVHAVVIDLNRRKVPTPTERSKRWSRQTVTGILRSPRIAGLRAHKGEIVGEAVWPAIVDRPTWDRLQRVLDGNATPVRHHGNRTYLLTGGLAVCGSCGAGLIARPRDSYRRYVCPPSTQDGCGGVVVTGDGLDDLVRDAVLARLDTPALAEAIEAITGDDEAEAHRYEELRQAEEHLEELARDFGSGEVSRREYLAMREAATQRVEAARRELRSSRNGDVLAVLPQGGLREAWDDRTLDWRRSLVAVLAEAVVVHPVGGNRWNPDRVEVRWRG